VWNTADERIQSAQMTRADQDRNVTFRQAFDVTAKTFVKLADETMRELDVAPDGKWAVGRDTRGYIHDYKRPAADFYRVNTATGERTLFAKAQLTSGATFGISPHGTHFLFWKDNRFQAYAFETGVTTPLGGTSKISFVDLEYDHPGPKPPYGIAGFTKDGKAVIAHHRYDEWTIPLDGSPATNLTGGLGDKSETRYRIVRVDPVDMTIPRWEGPRGTIDLSRPVTLSTYGEWTKKAGFSELAGGQVKSLVWEDASFSVPVKAKNADRFLFTRQTFVEFPDLRVSSPGLADAKKITDANPQQKDFLWGHRVLFDYKNKDGVRLQGIVALPDDYTPGEKRPMLVTFYEKNSQGMHRYTAPSYLSGMGGSPIQAVSNGYLFMLPDVHFRTGNSHSDMLECVEAATRKVIELGYADPKRIGVHGHSYGGEGAAFVGVMSKMFAAVGMGAGVVDLYNDFSQNWGWAYSYSGGSGANGNDYYLYGQGRWGFSPWDQPEKYRFESALTHVPQVTTPFLIMHGTSDPTVDFNNGLAFYNALRYNGKKAVLLAYPNEGHGLRGLANRKDLTIRYFEFFDHYLKGAKAPAWMTEGVPYLKKDAKPEPPKEPAPASTAKPEATSLLGTPLYAIELAPDAKQAVEARVAAAREALSKTPDSPDAILWLGRQTAAAGRVRLAIDIFTKGIAQFPADPRFYRHRGHRYVTVREFDKAIADLAHAAQLIKGKPDQPEPSTADATVMSSETLHYAIYYHLGLAHYLKGDFAAALPVYRQCLAAAKANVSDDLTAGASDWLYMTLRRLGRAEEAAKVLEPIVPGMKVKDDQQYYDRLMMYKGAKKPEELLAAGKDPVSKATLAYGVANWYLYNGRKDEAKALFQKIVTGPNWMPFGFIAAEAELARMR
jgi:tetratricopeptide (TPR) repeat protein